jgi:hypothetical protein
MRQHASAYVLLQPQSQGRLNAYLRPLHREVHAPLRFANLSAYVSAYISMRQHTSAQTLAARAPPPPPQHRRPPPAPPAAQHQRCAPARPLARAPRSRRPPRMPTRERALRQRVRAREAARIECAARSAPPRSVCAPPALPPA